MKEQVEIRITAFNNGLKGPTFEILLNQRLLDRQENYLRNEYTGTFDIVPENSNKLIIRHVDKSPKDTLMKNGEVVGDVAIRLDEIKFNNISCHPVDLHENYFYPENWKYEVAKKIKNNLYFGFNGRYEYCFNSPVARYVLSQHERHTKEDFVLDKLDEYTDEKFLALLKQQIDSETKNFF